METSLCINGVSVDTGDTDSLMMMTQEIVGAAAVNALVLFVLFVCVATLKNMQQRVHRHWIQFFLNVLLVAPITVAALVAVLVFATPPDYMIRRVAVFAFGMERPGSASLVRLVVSLTATMAVKEALRLVRLIVSTNDKQHDEEDSTLRGNSWAFLVNSFLPVALPLVFGPLPVHDSFCVLCVFILVT